MPEARLQRTRANYQLMPFALQTAFQAARNSVERPELPRGEAGVDTVTGTVSAPPVAHQSAKACGCDPGCGYVCEQHSDPALNFIPQLGD